MDVKLVEKRAIAIADNYYRKISPKEREKKQIEIWLDNKPKIVKILRREKDKAIKRVAILTKEIAELAKEREEKILPLYQNNKLAAKELSSLHGGDFKKRPPSYGITTVEEAFSEKKQEVAYHCGHCELWVVGSPRNGQVPEARFFAPHDRYFCRICDNVVGRLKVDVRRSLDRSCRP